MSIPVLAAVVRFVHNLYVKRNDTQSDFFAGLMVFGRVNQPFVAAGKNFDLVMYAFENHGRNLPFEKAV